MRAVLEQELKEDQKESWAAESYNLSITTHNLDREIQ